MAVVKDEKILKLRLRVLSPVHIGTGSKLTKWDFVVRGSYLLVLNQDKFFEYLVKKGKLEEAISRMERNEGSANDYLEYRIPQELVKYKLQINPSIDLQRANKKEVLEAVKNFKKGSSDGLIAVPYIPASEIKGFIRTAIIYNYLKDHQDRFREKFANVNKRFDFRKSIEKEIFGKPTKDLMKYIKIEDIHGNFNLEIVGVRILLSSRNFPEFVEAIVEGASDVFRVTLDIGRLGGKIGKYIKDWKRCCYTLSKDLIEAEYHYWYDLLSGNLTIRNIITRIEELNLNYVRKVLNQIKDLKYLNTEDKPLVRIGKYTGFLNHTIALLLNSEGSKYKNPQPYNVAPLGNDIGATNAKWFLFPLTRRITFDNKTLGWCRLEES